ncbi:hypothetical protein E2C01_045017 [Portunus trituberculatus]|uniref:Uncharacterized protein n=1 Tax=Portunus trituberculatus TaxID=210409 RepID=A0A5B7G0N7_PORTR|nr:hypothetical protein [Portunus trituberculatus]
MNNKATASNKPPLITRLRGLSPYTYSRALCTLSPLWEAGSFIVYKHVFEIVKYRVAPEKLV